MVNDKVRYGLVDHTGKVMRSWFSESDIMDISKEIGLDIPLKNKIPYLISKLEDMGFLVMSYGTIGDYDIPVPIDDLYEEWEYIQREYYNS